MFLKKLPSAFQQDSLITTIGRHLQNKKVLFSSVLYSENNKNYNIIKSSHTPYFQKDWQIYSLLRGLAKTEITSGKTLRYQKDTYKSQCTHGDKNIAQMCKNFLSGSKHNVYVMTNTMSKNDLINYFDRNLYNLIDSDVLKSQHKDKKITLKQVVEDITAKNLGPALIACGPTVLKEYFEKIKKQRQKNIIDGGYLSFFQGELPKQAKGDQFVFQEDLFETVWKSDSIEVKDKGKQIGKMYFKVYKNKNS